jgi:type I restriction enzyme S subunit
MNKETYRLEDLCTSKGSYGIGAPAVAYDANKYTYLRITDINDDGTLNHNGLMSVDDERAGDYLLKENDIVFARTGNSTGRTYFYDGRDGELVYAGFLIKFSLDSEKVNPRILKYYTHSQPYYDWVRSFDTGGTRGNINAKAFGAMPITLPPRHQQDKIVEILKSLDDKIELNRRINANLEAQAQALFRSWFVDFEPFRDGPFVDSELGKIPQGWKVGDIYTYMNVIYGAPYKSALFNTDKKGYPLIRIRDLKTYSPQFYTEEILPNTEYVDFGDIVAGMDAEFVPYIWKGEKGLLNQRVCKFIPRYDYVSKYYILSLIRPELEFVQSYKVGTTVSHLGKSDIDKFKVITPPDEIVKRFSCIVDSFHQQIIKLAKESLNLSALRDTLLPKLMAGEINLD